MSIGKIVVAAKSQIDIEIRQVTIRIFSDVIKGTPVGDPTYWYNYAPPPGYVGGRARGNWQASEGTPIRQEIDRIDGKGEITKDEAISRIVTGTVMYLSNNVPYIRELEEGYSKRQAPMGWIKASIMRHARKV